MDKEFLHTVAGLVQERLGDGYEVEADEDVCNGKTYPCIRIRPAGEEYATTAVLKGRAKSAERMAKAVVVGFLENQEALKNSGIFEFVKSKENVLGSVKPALVNYEKNRTMLAGVPHLRFLDLAITYRISIENDDGISSVLLSSDLMNYLGITSNELDEAAARNLVAEEIDYADDFVDAFCEEVGSDPEDLFTIVTNKSHLYGAAMMLNPRVLESVADKIGLDHFYVVPSSIHEFLVATPYAIGDRTFGTLLTMTKTINADRRVISESDALSDNVYEYRRGKGLKIAGYPTERR